MGLDLTDPKELDWLARGRNGEVASFEESHPQEERQQEAYDELIKHIIIVLQSREVDDRQRSEKELKKAAEGILSPMTDEEVFRIGKRVWEKLANTETLSERFTELYWRSFADELVDYWDEKYRDRGRNKKLAGGAGTHGPKR